MELNFTHIVDANHIIKIFNAGLLNNIYDGNSDDACEFLVLGKLTSDAMNIMIPNHSAGQMIEAPLTNAKTKLVLKVIKYDTGDIIGTFVAQRAGIGGTTVRALDTAIAPLATESADKLANVFRGFSAKSNQGGVRVTINAASPEVAEEIITALRSRTNKNIVVEKATANSIDLRVL